MIPPLMAQEIARQRQLELIAEAKRYRRRDRHDHDQTGASKSSVSEVGRARPLGRLMRRVLPAWPW